MNQSRNTIGLGGQILFILCAVLIIDTLTAAAALGPSVIGWWGLTLLAFVVPYALIATELGTAYPADGGLYDWVKRAFGDKMAARTSWLYWINVGLWMPAVYILFAGMASELFDLELSLAAQVGLCILLTWLTVWFCNVAVDIGVGISKVGALLKMVVILALGIAGFLYAKEHGMANELTWQSMLPSFEGGVGFLPAIIYNLLGLELVACLGRDLKDPVRSMPKAMLLASLAIALLYVFGTLGILAALPVDQVGLVAGLTDALKILFADLPHGQLWVMGLGILGLLTLISNMVSWTMGSSRAAAESAQAGELPALLGYRHRRLGTPVGANCLTGLVSTAVILCYGLLASSNDELFWTVFAFSSTVFLLPYLLMFAAFLRLRLSDARHPRPFPLPASRPLAWLLTGCSLSFILGALLLFIFPQLAEGIIDWQESGPLLLGLGLTLLLGEVLIHRRLGRTAQPELARHSAG